MNKKTLKDFKLKGERVILRVDFNVPINRNGIITNDKRILEALPTIKYLISQKAKIILITHLGRPNGKVEPSLSVKPIADYLRNILDTNVFFSPEILGEETKRLSRLLDEGEILMLENIRFEKGEEENDNEFAKKLSKLGDYYCLDAFGTSHRAHASTCAIAQYLPSCCGFLMEKEIDMLSRLTEEPKHPFVVVLGGSKIKDKISLFNHLIDKVDKLIIGGAMAYTFINALGYQTGESFVEPGKIELAKLLIKKAKAKNVEIFLPLDHVVASEFSFLANYIHCDTNKFPVDGIGMDIGPKTIKVYEKVLKDAKTIFWNGPMGVFEFKRFSQGTNAIAKAIASNKNLTIVGGGDSATVVANLGIEKQFTYVSTGGGASLMYLEGSQLPGLINIEEKGEEVGARIHKEHIENLDDQESQKDEDENVQENEPTILNMQINEDGQIVASDSKNESIDE